MPALHDIVTKDATDRSVVVHIMDSTDGTPETGVVFNTSGIDLWYRREGAARTAITEATLAALTTTHTDGGFLHISDGDYRLDLPDAAFATGANYVDFGGTVTGMIVVGGRVRLVDADMEVASMGALRPTTAGRTLDVASTGEAGLDYANVTIPDGPVSALGIVEGGTAQSATATTLVGRAAGAVADDAFNGCILQVFGSTQGYWQTVLITDTTLATDTFTVAAWPAATPSGTITYRIFGTPAGQLTGTQTFDMVGNITGNLSGSVGSVTGAVGSVTGAVGSVTGAVGSVTGNVGGNVAGSVASVTGAVGSVTGLTASDVGAIKTKTDSLTFTQAGHVDANVQRINDVAITGDGQSGTEFSV